MERFIRYRKSLAAFAVVLMWAVGLLYAQNRIAPGPNNVLFRLMTATDTTTLTTSQFAPGLLIGTPTTGATYTLPTGANLCTALPAVAVIAPGTNTNYGYDLWIRNTSLGANTITLSTSGVQGATLAAGNTNSVAQNHTRLFKVVPTNCSTTFTYTVYSGPDSAH